MTTIGDQLAAEWHDDETRIKDWFHQHARHDATPAPHGPPIAVQAPPAPPAPQENTMPVSDAAADLKTNVDTVQSSLDAANAALSAIRTNDVPGLQDLGQQIDNSEIILAAIGAEGVVPAQLLAATAAYLRELAASFAPAAAPVAPVAPADQSAA